MCFVEASRRFGEDVNKQGLDSNNIRDLQRALDCIA